MPDLPPELWIITLDRLRFQPSTDIFPAPLDVPTLKALTLTSRSFQSLAEPLIYERVRLQGYDPTARQKVDRLTSRPDMLLWIKYLTVFNCLAGAYAGYRYILSLCPKLLSLQGICLKFTKIEVQTALAIVRLPSLEIWEAIGVQFEDNTGSIDFSAEQLRLKHVGLGLAPASDADNKILTKLVLSPSLHSLGLLHGPTTSAALPLLNATNSPSILPLRSFQCDIPPNINDLYDFLLRCPSITYISLWDPTVGRPFSNPPPLPPPPDLLPSLRAIKGSSRSAQYFVPGRPVDNISISYIHDPGDDKALFKSLEKSSVSVTAFCMTLLASTFKPAFAALASAFPALISLRIEAPRCTDQVCR